MKKLLLLFCALLCLGGSKAWGTTPGTSALPKIGRTYYLSVTYNNTKRYIYCDASTKTLKSTTTAPEAGDKEYLWFVFGLNGKYQFFNVASEYCLGWRAMQSTGDPRTARSFSLNEDVIDDSCVPLTNGSTGSDLRYMVTKITEDNTFDQYTVAVNNGTWCSDYLFEEFTSPVVTAGNVYYIYCDNDENQYFYNNDSSLGVANSNSESNSRYMWIAELTDDGYYAFRNVNGQKYLGWKNVTTDAYKWSVNTNMALKTGNASMFSSVQSAYLVMKNDNYFSNAYGRYNKASSDYSSDFCFTAVSTSSYDIYSVTINSPSSITPYITYSGEGYVNPNIYNGGKLVVTTGTSVAASDFTAYNAGSNYNQTDIRVDSENKTITITYTIKWQDLITAYLSDHAVATQLGKTGVGYPKSAATARTELQTIYNTVIAPSYDYLTNGETDYSTLTTKYTAYLNCTDIDMPEEGKIYYFINYQKKSGGTINKNILYRIDKSRELDVTTFGDEDPIYPSTDYFIAHKLPNSEYIFVSYGDRNAHFVIARSNNCTMTNGYDVTYSPVYVKQLIAANTINTNSQIVEPEEYFGGFYFQGTRRDGTTNGIIVVSSATPGKFNAIHTNPFFRSDYSSAFHIYEVDAATVPYYNTVNMRKAGDHSYASTYLPLAVQLPEHVKAYKASAPVEDVMKMTKVADGDDPANNVLPALTPAILWSENAEVTGNQTLAFVTSNLSAPDDNALSGTLADNTTVSATTYVLYGDASSAGFYPLDGTTAPTCKAYYDAGVAGVKSFSFSFEDIVDGIQKAELDERLSEGPVYDLSGRHIEKPMRGIYIQNGRKFIIK